MKTHSAPTQVKVETKLQPSLFLGFKEDSVTVVPAESQCMVLGINTLFERS